MIRILAATLLLFIATGAQAQESIISQLQKQPADSLTLGLDRADRALSASLLGRKSETWAILQLVNNEFRAIGNARVPGAPNLRLLCESVVAEVKYAFLWNHIEGKAQITDSRGSIFATYFTPAGKEPTEAMRDQMDKLFVVYAIVTDGKSVMTCRSRMREKTVHFD